MEHHFQPDPQTILRDLQSEDTDIIRQAAFEAGDNRLESAVEQLCALVQRSNIGVQEAAEYALRKIRGTRTIESMLPLLRSDDAPIRNIAMDVLREIGSDDISALQPLLHDSDPDMRIFMADILGCTANRMAVSPLCEALLKDPEVNVRYQAAVSLGTLAFPEAVDALRQAMHDEEWVQFSVVEALTKIRADSTISALVQSLNSCSDLVASIIIDALGEIGNIKAVPLLFKFLDKTSAPLRHKTVKALVQILGGRSLSLLSAKDQLRFRDYLIDALQDEDEGIQKAVLIGLEAMGNAEATSVVMQFASKLDPDRNHDLLAAAVRTLAAMGYNDTFEQSITSSNTFIVRLTVEACALMQDHQCVELLKRAFWNLDRDNQRLASAQLAKNAEEQDIPFFLDMLSRPIDADILKNVVYFLGVRMHCQEARDQIFDLLDHPYDDVKEAALEACISMHSPELNLRFKELSHSSEALKRMMAIYALSRFSLETNLPELTDALEDESPNVRQLAVEGFGMSKAPLSKYLSELLPRLYDESRDVRVALVELLGKSASPEAVPHLVTALSDGDEWVRIRAAEALGTLKDKDAAPQLVQLLEHASPLLTFKIVDVLGEIGGNVAFKALLGLMDHENQEIQQAATEAISKIKATGE